MKEIIKTGVGTNEILIENKLIELSKANFGPLKRLLILKIS